MNMIQRHSQLINKFLGCDEVRLQCLAEELKVSERTLRNDIQGLKEMLSDESLITISKGSVKVSNKIAFNNEVTKILEESNFYQYRLSNNERQAMEALFILYGDGYTTTNYLADKLSVSRSTIANEIKDMKDWFSERDLNLIAKPKKGYRIDGDERQIRKAINELVCISCQSNGEGIYRALIEKEMEGKVNRNQISQTVLNYELLNKIDLMDECFKTIENYLVVVINRAITGKVIGNTHPKRGKGTQRFSYEILNKLFQEYGIEKPLTQEEVNLLKDELENCMYIDNKPTKPESDVVNIQMQISAFVWAVCMSLDIKEKIGFRNYELLLKHIESTILHFRKSDIPRVNPLCSELEEMYPEVFEHVGKYINHIERLIGKKLGKDDISFIVMHIAAALETVKAENVPIHALLICPAGLCTAMLLQVKLKQNFNIIVDNVIPCHKLRSYDRTNIDLIISTVPIKDDKNLFIQINPLLYEKDITNLRKFIDDNNLGRKCKEQADKLELNRIISYVDEYHRIISQDLSKDEEYLKAMLHQLNKRYSVDDSKNHSYKWFYSALTKDQMVLDADVDTWQEGVRLAGKILEKNGKSTSAYTEKMVELIMKNGPYVVFAPGIAVVHASPSDGAKSLGISFIRLKEPIEFNHELNDPVRFILGVSIPDEKSHLQVFFHMVKCMANKDVQKILYNAKSKTDIINIIKLYEMNQFPNS